MGHISNLLTEDDTPIGRDIRFVPVEWESSLGRAPGDPTLHEIWNVRTKEIQATWDEVTERQRCTTPSVEWTVPRSEESDRESMFSTVGDEWLGGDVVDRDPVTGKDGEQPNRGDNLRGAKLTEAEVVMIRFSGRKPRKLMKLIDVSKSRISLLRRGVGWRYITRKFAELNYSEELSAWNQL